MGILTSYPLATLFVIAVAVFVIVLWRTNKSDRGQDNRDGSASHKCRKCGAALHAEAKFCQRCGERV